MGCRSCLWRLVKIGLVVLLLAAGAYFLLGRLSAPTLTSPVTRATRAIPAVTGVAPKLVAVNDAWPAYRNQKMGLAVRYPPGWKAVEQAGQSGIALYPPDGDPEELWPHIAIVFAAEMPYDPKASSLPHRSPFQTLKVGGITGRLSRDIGFAAPTLGMHIEVPYRNGTLLISVPEGPSVNLGPQFREILKTIDVGP